MRSSQRPDGSRPTTLRSTARILRAFEMGAFELAASELASCRSDEEPHEQLRIASEMESVARTTLGLGELLVRFELTDPRAPAAALGQSLLDQLEVSLARLKERASQGEGTAPVDPSVGPEHAERFLVERVAPSAAFLRSPFRASGRGPRLLERNRNGYDIWWGGCFFALPHGRSPRLAYHLLRLIVGARHDLRSWIPRWVRALRKLVRLARALLRWRATRPGTPAHPAVLSVPLLGLSATRTGLEMQQHLARPTT